MPEVQNISLKLKNDGTLQLLPQENIRAWKSDFVVWSIERGSNISKFEIFYKSGASIFLIGPHQNGPVWSAEVSNDAIRDSVYSYGIRYWIGTDPNPKTKDPIIAIRPSLILQASEKNLRYFSAVEEFEKTKGRQPRGIVMSTNEFTRILKEDFNITDPDTNITLVLNDIPMWASDQVTDDQYVLIQ